MDINKKIRDSFNPPPSLDGEEWLVPSANVWDAIENEIKPKKKNRVVFIILLSFAVILAAVVSYFLFTSSSTTSQSEELPVSSTAKGYHDTSTTNSTDLHSKLVVVDKTENIIAPDNARSYQKSTSQNINVTNETNELKSHSTSSARSYVVDQSQIKPIRSSQNMPAINDIFDQFSVEGVLSEKAYVNGLSPITDVASRTMILDANLESMRMNALAMQDLQVEVPALPNPLIVENAGKDTPRNSILISSGFSSWNFNMSDSYLSALQPADFSSTNGSGGFVQLGLQKYFSPRFHMVVDLHFEYIEFQSGHNSEVTYSKSGENSDQSNSFDLVMASPIGFVESNIVVSRRGSDLGDAQNLILDLHNSHRISSLGTSVSIGYDLVKKNKWNVGVSSGVGLNYLMYTNNTLDEFNTDHADYKSDAKIVTVDQSISSLLPFLRLGAFASYQINDNSRLYVQYNFSQDVRNVYQLNDFSTRISRQNLGVGLSYNF